MADGQKVDLPRLAAQAGLRTAKTAPVFTPTAAQEAQLERIIKQIVAAWNVALREDVLPSFREAMRRRAGVTLALGVSSGELALIEESLNRATTATVAKATGLEAAVSEFVVSFTAWHTARFAQTIMSASGVNVLPVLTTEDASDYMRAAIRRNVSLIKGLNEDMRRKVETSVLNAWNENSSAAKLTRTLKRDLGFSPARAKLIGRDQVSKLAGELDKMRSESLGIKSYVWVTMGDDRVRDSHAANDGRAFTWASPPAETGHPGNDINCRCRARPIVEPRT